MYASRNIALCTKDCLCLFICPTGATDTPDGQIDSKRCLDGCRLCVDACPSHAIHLVFNTYPEPAPKDKEVADVLIELCEAKIAQETIAVAVAENENTPQGARLLAKALKRSARIMAEDCAREAGYLHPQCKASQDLIKSLKD